MRDPRVDPRPGDELHAEGGQRRTVDAISGGEVFYRTKSGALKNSTMTQWRKWAGQEWVVVIAPKAGP